MSEENPINRAVEQDAVESSRGRFGWLGTAVAIVFGFVYAYYLWDAVRNLVELPGFYELIGLTAADVPWWLLTVGLLMPIAVYVAAFLVGRHRSVLAKSLIFLVGLGAVATLSLSLVALEAVLRPSPFQQLLG